MPDAQRRTRAAHVHDQIRHDILAARLQPGSPLRLAALAKTYDASMSVVREALGRLAEHNLAVLTPNQGFRVVEVSIKDLTELTDLRALIEGGALERSMRCGDVRWEADVVSAHHYLDRLTMSSGGASPSTQEWSDAHAAFHHALIAACDNSRMLTLAGNLRDSAEIYRQFSGSAKEASRRDVAAEHRELMELATARDKRAPDALVAHLRRTTELLLTSPELLGQATAVSSR